jgi:hypothetical protein
LILSLLAVIKYVVVVDTRSKTRAKGEGRDWWLGRELGS